MFQKDQWNSRLVDHDKAHPCHQRWVMDAEAGDRVMDLTGALCEVEPVGTWYLQCMCIYIYIYI